PSTWPPTNLWSRLTPRGTNVSPRRLSTKRSPSTPTQCSRGCHASTSVTEDVVSGTVGGVTAAVVPGEGSVVAVTGAIVSATSPAPAQAASKTPRITNNANRFIARSPYFGPSNPPDLRRAGNRRAKRAGSAVEGGVEVFGHRLRGDFRQVLLGGAAHL